MILAAVVLVSGLAGMATLATVQVRAARLSTGELLTYNMRLPANLSSDDVARWLNMLALCTRVPRWSLQAPRCVGLEVRSTNQGIEHYLRVPARHETTVLQSLRAGLPGARLELLDNSAEEAVPLRYAREVRLTNSRRQLAVERAEAVATAFLTSLQPLAGGQVVRAVWYVGGYGTPRPTAVEDADGQRALQAKQREPLLLVSIRIGASASTVAQAKAVVIRSTAALSGMNVPGARVSPGRLPASFVMRRMNRSVLPRRNWLTLNSRELSGLIGFPLGESFVTGLSVGAARQLPPASTAARTGLVLARANYQGTSGQPLRLATPDRLRHLWLLGPTGVGKSTLLANMALQDAAAGRGFALIDPKSDLVEDILARLPEARRDDVIVLDPTAFTTGREIVGLNVLGEGRSEHARELAVDHITHVMGSIWSSSWGPRSADIVRSSLLTLASATGMDGNRFTLVEVAELLMNAAFRRFVVSQPSVPDVVRPFWAAYEAYSEAQRLQVVGPVLNKLRALGTRTPLRLMLGQSAGIDLSAVFNQNKILLVPLSKGTIGTESAALLGSLMVASLVHAVFARAALPAARRKPTFVYLDEFQDVLRLPLDLADALAQARGLGVGFVLANQYVGQLPDGMRRAVFGTVRSTVLFQLQDYDDARLFERSFAPLTAGDLMHQPAYEVALRLCENNTTGRPATGVSLPLPNATSDGSALAAYSAGRFGAGRADVEAALRARITRSTSPGQAGGSTGYGRRKVGGEG